MLLTLKPSENFDEGNLTWVTRCASIWEAPSREGRKQSFMQRIFVLSPEHAALSPCRPARARWLLTQKRAAVFRRYPFTIILKQPPSGAAPLRLKIDPGSKTTGMAVVNDATGEVVWAAELSHRGQQVKEALDSRRATRRSRRQRHTRYRQPRFDNRTRPTGWLRHRSEAASRMCSRGWSGYVDVRPSETFPLSWPVSTCSSWSSPIPPASSISRAP